MVTLTKPSAGDTDWATEVNANWTAIEDIIGTAMTAGSVLFAGANGKYAQDNTNLFWDDTNKRLGIGTSSPQSKLTVEGVVTLDELGVDPSAISGYSALYALANGKLYHRASTWPRSGAITDLCATWNGMEADTLAQITSNQNDYALGSNTVQRLSTDASRTITGIDARALKGFIIINVGSNDLILANQNAGSAAANRIITGTGANVTLNANDSCIIWYDSDTARWRIVPYR